MEPSSEAAAASVHPGQRLLALLASNKRRVLEAFVAANFAFLVLDIYVAHSVNEFKNPNEWIPFWFSIVAALGLVPALLAPRSGYARWGGALIGWAAIGVGIAGALFHLESQFFQQMSLQSLVYTAPFAAPLAYAGLGFLLVLNRMLPETATQEWSRWVVFFALGGFVGNFALSLCDHAQNGFFHWTEWIPVAASALAIGFLTVTLWVSARAFLAWTAGVLVLQVAVGLLGFVLHVQADVNGISASVVENFLHGAPVFAPLLFANLAILGGFGVWDLGTTATPEATAPEATEPEATAPEATT
ncbi:MAG: hypothetical protein JKY65_22710 [Planctomycetes bacterium]|nr:hypothetical protein [Planctomycetota bacterium]